MFFVLQFAIIFIGIPATIAAIYIKSELIKRNISITWLYVSLSELIEYYKLSKLEDNLGKKRQMKAIFCLSLGTYLMVFVFVIYFISLFFLS